MLLVIFILGVMITFFGLAGIVYSLLQIMGISAFSVWLLALCRGVHRRPG